MQFRFCSWGATDWKCFKDVSFSLPTKGAVTISGDNRDEPGCAHNGVGKTSLVEIPMFTLFGPPNAEARVAAYARLGAGPFKTWTEFERNGVPFRVVRTKAGAKIYKKGKLLKIASRSIPSYLGISRVMFRNAVGVSFGQESLLNLSPEKLAVFFQEMCGLDFSASLARAAKMHTAAQVAIQRYGDQCRTVERRRGEAKGRLAALREVFDRPQDSSAPPTAQALRIARKKLALDDADLSRAFRRIEKENRKIERAEMCIAAFTEPTKCRLCGHSLSGTDRPDLAQHDQAQSTLKQARGMVSVLSRCCRNAAKKIKEAQISIAVGEERRRTARRYKAERRELSHDIATAHHAVVNLDVLLGVASTSLKRAENLRDAAAYWRAALSPRGGYTALALQSVLDVYCESANEWAARFFSACKITARVETGARSLSVVLDVGNATSGPWELCSKGEKQRVALALFFGANSLYRQEVDLNYMCLDDYDFALDVEGRAVLVEIIREVSQECVVLLATQSSDVLRAFDQGACLVKEAKISTLSPTTR